MHNENLMRRALLKIYDLVSKDNIHGRWCERCNEDVGSGKPHKDQCLSRYILKLAKQALAAEPAPLVRLTDEDALELHRKSTEVWLAQDCKPRIGIIFANAIMDAMERVNGRKV